MKRSATLAAALLICISFALSARAGCDGAGFDGFDFWLGSWDIDQRFRAGEGEWIELPASTSVEKILDGCAIEENWQGLVQYPWLGMEEPEPMKGFSLRYFDPEKKVWAIRWIDSLEPTLGSPRYGAIREGRGEFNPVPEPGSVRWTRIVFEQKTPNRVFWQLDLTADGGDSWVTIWTMDMRRRVGKDQE